MGPEYGRLRAASTARNAGGLFAIRGDFRAALPDGAVRGTLRSEIVEGALAVCHVEIHDWRMGGRHQD